MANWGIMPWGLLAIPSAWKPSLMEIFMAFGLMGDPAHPLLENRQKISFRVVIEWRFSQKEKFFHPILWTVSPLPPPLLYSRYFCSNPRTLNLEVLGISLFFFFFLKKNPKALEKMYLVNLKSSIILIRSFHGEEQFPSISLQAP